MTKDFIPYEEALELKKLDFDEECIYHYKKDNEGKHTSTPTFEMLTSFGKNHNLLESRVSAPLYQQAFRWFRKKYNLHVYIDFYHKDSYFYKIKSQIGKKVSKSTGDIILQGSLLFPIAYEEAELACLKKLIEIVKTITS